MVFTWMNAEGQITCSAMCAEESKQKKTKKIEKRNGCVEIQILSMARGNRGLSAFIVASPSWLAWSPWQITSAWPPHRQPPNPGRVALKGLNVKPPRSAHHIASAAARRLLASTTGNTRGQRETIGRAPRRKTKMKHKRHSLFCSTGVSWGGGGGRTQWVICSTHHMSLPFVSQVLMLNQTAQHAAENRTFAVSRFGFTLARSPFNA